MTPSIALFVSLLVGLSSAAMAWLSLSRLVLHGPRLQQWFSPFRKSIRAGLGQTFLRLTALMRPWLAPMVSPDAALRGRLQLLGFPPDFDEASWLAVKMILAIGLPGIGFLLPGLWLHHRVQTERDAAQRGFPALLDGLALSLEAGQSLGQALLLASQRSGQETSSPWRQMVKTFAIDIRGGASRAAAVARLQAALPIAVVQQFGALVLVAEQAGLSMGKILRSQAAQARRVYQLQIEARAMKAPVKLMGPLVFCIFPCTFIVLLAPLLVRLVEALGGA